MSRSTRWIVVSVVLALVVVLLAPFVYSEVQEGRTPPPLGLQSPGEETASAAPAPPGPFDVDGVWVVGPGSEAGFRAEVLDVPADEAVLLGVTPDVSGSFRVQGGELRTATVTVATTTLRTGSSVADRQLQQALETDLYPTTLFSLTAPLDVSALGSTTEPVRLEAPGALTIRDETLSVTVALEAQRSGSGVLATGAIGVRFSDYGIAVPPDAPVQVDDVGTVEVRLELVRPVSP
ncbi:YceI family protein [Cellulosimicrobium composti]|uniref:YceI family protein n=1 Tax=Cellulosimicrobium composti TaxID=2672572 RepID=A0ABX0B9Y9_9MICO|nr:YceI family protein [Cellulosimicrobium composti]NDO89397.1 YceI family protein [Cellulosimicrobium composti]